MDKLEATGLLKRYQGEDKEGYNYCNNPYSPYYGELNCMITEDYDPDDWEVVEEISANGYASSISFRKKENKT
jgi:hypothetical protein